MSAAVSIVICTKDRRADLAHALASIRSCAPAAREAEIVVVEETNDPAPIPGTVYVPIPRAGRGFGYARNRALDAAHGDVIVFIDDDCEAAPGWLPALLAPLRADADVIGVAGSVMVRDCNLVGYAENVLGFPGGGLRYAAAAGGRVRETRHLSTCNCAYRRAALERAGRFATTAVWGGEDALLAERVAASGRCVYAPDAVVYHKPRGSLVRVFRWFVRRGRSDVQILAVRRQPARAAFTLAWSSLAVRALVAAALLVLLPLPAVPALITLAVAWVAVVLWRFRFALSFTPHRRAWLLVPLVKSAMDLGTEVGKVREVGARLLWRRDAAGARGR